MEDTLTPAPMPAAEKPIHSLILDTGPLIKNDPPADILRARATQLYTLPSILAEIRDAATRARIETTLMPFVEVRAPRQESYKFVQGFARGTGDLAVLSRQDLEVLALGYEIECERNGGDWRLRKTPGQKGVNGRPPGREGQKEGEGEKTEGEDADGKTGEGETNPTPEVSPETPAEVKETPVEDDLHRLKLSEIKEPVTDKDDPILIPGEKDDEQPEEVNEASDSDSDGWITPSNLKKHQAADTTNTPTTPVQKTLQAAVLTSDYAMQNVALRINLNLLSPSLTRITHLKTWVLRCHGCFKITREMERQFCPSCGQPTLTRVSCSTDDRGNFTVHLKKNFQWNKRGNVYSVPKPTHGSASGKKAPGGGKNGWGNGLILAEDQKEFVRRNEEDKRSRRREMMDEDTLPGLLTGERRNQGGRIRVGAGRNVNSRRKH